MARHLHPLSRSPLLRLSVRVVMHRFYTHTHQPPTRVRPEGARAASSARTSHPDPPIGWRVFCILSPDLLTSDCLFASLCTTYTHTRQSAPRGRTGAQSR